MAALAAAHRNFDIWQARRDSNPQHPVLETGALPVGATGLHFVKRPSKKYTRFEATSSLYVPYDDGTVDRTSSFPDALWSFSCF
jgi:hypothetical protein